MRSAAFAPLSYASPAPEHPNALPVQRTAHADLRCANPSPGHAVHRLSLATLTIASASQCCSLPRPSRALPNLSPPQPVHCFPLPLRSCAVPLPSLAKPLPTRATPLPHCALAVHRPSVPLPRFASASLCHSFPRPMPGVTRLCQCQPTPYRDGPLPLRSGTLPIQPNPLAALCIASPMPGFPFPLPSCPVTILPHSQPLPFMNRSDPRPPRIRHCADTQTLNGLLNFCDTRF